MFPFLRPGRYAIRVEKPGFSTGEMNNLAIEVGEQAYVEMKLHLGEVQTVITVLPPNLVELDSESNTIGSTIDSTRVRELPLNGRNFLQLSKLSADTIDISPASNIFTSNVGPPDRTIVLPGTLPNSVNYSLNGINITGSRDGELALSPSVAAVDQFRVQQSFLMPDQGTNPGIVNIITKSGSNQFHGEIFEFLRNSHLDARSFFSAGPENLHRNQFGGAVGGPVWKNRLWFHAFYEGLREISSFSTSGYSPTKDMFQGNFGALGRIIYNPLNFDPTTGTRGPFPDNIIPPSQINLVAKNLLKYYLPGSSLSQIPSNVQGNPGNTSDDDQGGLRFDAALNPQHHIFFQFFRQNTPTDQPALFPLSGLLYVNHSNLIMMQHAWTITPRAVNSLRLGFLSNTAVGANEAQGLGPILQSIGITNTYEDEGVTTIRLQGYSSFGRANGQVGNDDNTWQFDDELMYTTGSHSFAVGADVRYRRGWHFNANAGALGTLTFQPTFTAQLGSNAQGQLVPLANTGDAFADFLLGFPVTGQMNGLPVVQFRGTQFSPFFQDTWRVTQNLTINYGVSWFLDTPPDPRGTPRQYVHQLDSTTGLLKYSGLGQVSPQFLATDENNFAFRLGVAWHPGFLGRTVMRAAAGTYYLNFPWSVAPYSLLGGSPLGAGVTLTNAQTNPVPTYVMGVNVFPPSPAGALTTNYAANLPAGTTITALSPNFRTGYVNQWNFSIQHSLSQSDLIEVDYLGSSGHRLLNIQDAAQCRPTANLFCLPATRPWPLYGLIISADSSGNSSYQGAIAKYQHTITAGLNLRFEYSLAKALTDTYQSQLTAYNQISDCRSCSKGPATFNVRHRAVASVVWDLPVGRGRRFDTGTAEWLDLLAGGWTATAITTFATGQPVLLTAPNQTGSPFINPLPNRVCSGQNDQLSNNVRNNGFLWFDPSCFTVPPIGYFGNSGPTVLDGPGLNNWDLGVQKEIDVSEPAKIRIRAEFFNAWNHTQFDQPNGNAGAGTNFGRISSTRAPRLIQIAAKLLW